MSFCTSIAALQPLPGASATVPIMYILKPCKKNSTICALHSRSHYYQSHQRLSTARMRSSRANHLTASGHGKHYTSPQKPRDKRKTTTRVIIHGQEAKHQRLLAQLKALQTLHQQEPDSDVDIEPAQSDYIPDDEVDQATPTAVHEEPISTPSEDQRPADKIHRRTLPDSTTHSLYRLWKALLPSLLRPLLSYITHSNASVHPVVTHIQDICHRTACVTKSTSIVCLHFDCKFLVLY